MKPKRSKLSAILLAIFFGPLTWVYSYKDDGHKFWIGTIISILLCWTIFVPIIVWICAVADSFMLKNKVSYEWR